MFRFIPDVAANFISFTHSIFVVLFLGFDALYGFNIEYLRCMSMVYFVMDTLMFQLPKKSWTFTIHHIVSFVLVQKYLNLHDPRVNNTTIDIFKHAYFWIELSNWPIYIIYDFNKYMQSRDHNIEQQLQHIKVYLALMQIELVAFGLVRGTLFLHYVIVHPVMDTSLYQFFVLMSIMSGYWYLRMLRRYNATQVKVKASTHG